MEKKISTLKYHRQCGPRFRKQHCYSNMSDEFHASLALTPNSTTRCLIFKFDFLQTQFDTSQFTERRVNNLIKQESIDDLSSYLRTNTPNFDLSEIDVHYKKLFLTIFLSSLALLNFAMLTIIICALHHHYKTILIVSFLLTLVIFFSTKSDQYILHKIIITLQDRATEIETIIAQFNRSIFEPNKLQLKTGKYGSWIE